MFSLHDALPSYADPPPFPFPHGERGRSMGRIGRHPEQKPSQPSATQRQPTGQAQHPQYEVVPFHALVLRSNPALPAQAIKKPVGTGCELLTMMCRLRSEEHTSELQSLMRISYAVFCLKKKTQYHYQYKQIL